MYPLKLLVKCIVRYRFRSRVKGYSAALNHTPVWIIGNLTLGGTGKTPSIIAIAHILQQQGVKVGVVSRGYGSALPIYPHLVISSDTATQVGDEAKLIHQAGIDICIAANRFAAAKVLLHATKCTLILSDDGLQHYSLPRTLEIALVDKQQWFGNSQLLPMGPLREPIKRLTSLDAVLINYKFNAVASRELSNLPYSVTSFRVHFASLYVCNLTSGKKMQLTQWVQQHAHSAIHLISAIGDPQSFFKVMDEFNINYKQHVFIDHYQYTNADFVDFAVEDILLMTQKDAVKCQNLAIKQEVYYLAIETQISQSLGSWLQRKAKAQLELAAEHQLLKTK